MRIRFFLCLAILTLPCLHVACAAQQQQALSDQPAATLRVQAREVLLPVTVRDKKGALVTNLNIGDFTLTEDGHPQKIKSFTRESNLPFLLGLLVDTSRSLSGAIDSERKAADKFVDQMLPADPKSSPSNGKNQAFLIHFDREVELLEDFTSSRDKLHHELSEMGPSRAAQNSNQNSNQGPETSGDDRDRSRGDRGGTQLYDAIFLASDELMKPKDGRKALVVFSDGVDHGSKETLNDAVDAADRANLAVYTIYFKGEQERGEGTTPGMGGGHHGGGFPGGGGIGYPGGGGGYPGGGGGGGRRGGDHQAEVDGKKIMEKIAERTGGRYFEAKKKDNLDEIYGLIAEELRGQYLLTYTPDTVDKEGGFHKIALKTNKSDLTVVTREGYYAPGGESK